MMFPRLQDLIRFCDVPRSRDEIREFLGLTTNYYATQSYFNLMKLFQQRYLSTCLQPVHWHSQETVHEKQFVSTNSILRPLSFFAICSGKFNCSALNIVIAIKKHLHSWFSSYNIRTLQTHRWTGRQRTVKNTADYMTSRWWQHYVYNEGITELYSLAKNAKLRNMPTTIYFYNKYKLKINIMRSWAIENEVPVIYIMVFT